jgi:hypothetical protein
LFRAVSHIFEGVGTGFFPLGWAPSPLPTLDFGSHCALELRELLSAPEGDQGGAYLASHIEGVQLMLGENTHYMNMTCIFKYTLKSVVSHLWQPKCTCFQC